MPIGEVARRWSEMKVRGFQSAVNAAIKAQEKRDTLYQTLEDEKASQRP